MNRTLSAAAMSTIIGIFGAQAMADENLVEFRGGIGVIPISSGVVPTPTPSPPPLTSEVVNRNFVRGVPPPGQPWVIADLRATVKMDGTIRVDGRGLLLAGGNGVGGTANARVFATLICEAAPPFLEHNTDEQGVPLQPNGDFRIDDVLSEPPTDCPSPLLLIRSTANRGWFAAGIPKH